jgi:hypothetical protein
MRADREDQLSPQPTGRRFPVVELLLALAVIAGLILFWRYWQEGLAPTFPAIEIPPATKSVATSEPGLPPAPDIPRRDSPPAPAITDTTTPAAEAPEPAEAPVPEMDQPPPPPLLSPAEGDEMLRRQLAQTAGLNKLATSEKPLDTTAALIDGLGRGLILRKVVQASPPAPGFRVEQRGDVYYMDEANFDRYDGLAEQVSSLDITGLVNNFHALRPLCEGAYERLGLDPADFDNAIIRTLDFVIATPEIDEPIALKPKSVIYLYADPALEALPALQKQLLRMGPDNIRLIKIQAKNLREALLEQ